MSDGGAEEGCVKISLSLETKKVKFNEKWQWKKFVTSWDREYFISSFLFVKNIMKFNQQSLAYLIARCV